MDVGTVKPVLIFQRNVSKPASMDDDRTQATPAPQVAIAETKKGVVVPSSVLVVPEMISPPDKIVFEKFPRQTTLRWAPVLTRLPTALRLIGVRPHRRG